MPLKLLERLREHACARPDAPAIVEIGAPARVVTLGELQQLVDSFAALVAARVPPGGVVVICLPNRLECTVAFLGTLRAGCTGFLINPHVSDHELDRSVATADADSVVSTPYVNSPAAYTSITRLMHSCDPGRGRDTDSSFAR